MENVNGIKFSGRGRMLTGSVVCEVDAYYIITLIPALNVFLNPLNYLYTTTQSSFITYTSGVSFCPKSQLICIHLLDSIAFKLTNKLPLNSELVFTIVSRF